MEDSTKKRSREDDDWDEAFLKKISNTIPRSVTYPEEDDDFVSTLLGEDAGALHLYPANIVEFGAPDDPRFATKAIRHHMADVAPGSQPFAMLLGDATSEKIPGTRLPMKYSSLPNRPTLAVHARNADIMSKATPSVNPKNDLAKLIQ